MTQQLDLFEPPAPPMIEHIHCPRCGSIRPLADGEILFTMEDDPLLECEPELFWECRDCLVGVEHRVSLTIFALPGVQRLQSTTERGVTG